MGYVYILVNDSIPGLIKIGRTARDSPTRAKDLSNSTGIPTPFKVAFELSSDEYGQLEREMHNKLAKYCVASNREFFRCSVDKAKEVFEELHSEHLNYEWGVDQWERLKEPVTLNNHPINQRAKFLLAQMPEGPNDFYRISAMTWTRPHLYLLDLMMWYLENHSSEIVEDAAYIGLNPRDLEIQIEELWDLPPYEVMMWLIIPKGIFTDDELGDWELEEDRFLMETNPEVGGWVAIQHLLTLMEARQIKLQRELEE